MQGAQLFITAGVSFQCRMHSFLCRIKLTVSDHHGITLTFRTAAPRRSESHEYRWPLWRFNFRAPRREYCIACIVQRDFQFELGTEGDLQTHLAVKFQPPKEAAHSPRQECRKLWSGYKKDLNCFTAFLVICFCMKPETLKKVNTFERGPSEFC